MQRKKVLSGIRPTGSLHIGNYFGAVKNFVKLQEEFDCYFFIADYHSLTTHPSSEDLKDKVTTILIEYLACGLNPEKSNIYIQSSLKQVCELYLILNNFSYLGELERCSSFKEKARKNPNNINAGLLTYPTLMASDILIHNPDYVPVGKDQKQHLEMTKTFAKRFNNFHKKDIFKIPKPFNFGNELIKVPGFDGTGKMGKSEGNAIYLNDEDKAIKKKISRAVTDSGPKKQNQEKPEVIQNLFTILNLVSNKDTVDYFEEQYNSCKIKYGSLKEQISRDMISFISPIREKIFYYKGKKKLLEEYLKLGTNNAIKSAEKTMKLVRDIYNF